MTSGDAEIGIILDREAVQHNNGINRGDFGRTLTIADVRRAGDPLPLEFPSMVANIVDRLLLAQRVEIDSTSAKLGLGPRTLQRRLSEHGLSYRDLVLRCRMRRACELLKEPETTVDGIALEVGYASPPQFYRAFKAYIGTTPERYRAARS